MRVCYETSVKMQHPKPSERPLETSKVVYPTAQYSTLYLSFFRNEGKSAQRLGLKIP